MKVCRAPRYLFSSPPTSRRLSSNRTVYAVASTSQSNIRPHVLAEDGLTLADFASIQEPLFIGRNHSRLPDFLKTAPPSGSKYQEIRKDLRGLSLHTVCEEAKCPNIGECWGGKGGKEAATATIMLLGDTCTRACRFCSVKTSRAPSAPDPLEPEKTAEAIARWGIGYVVLTTVDRDDLPDSGAAHIAKTIKLIKQRKAGILLEALTGDFAGDLSGVDQAVEAGLDVYAHNVETVPSLQAVVRDRRANWNQSIAVLKRAHELGQKRVQAGKAKLLTKTSIMLGVGESKAEVIDALQKLREANIDIVTLGQYMRPTKAHMPVSEYVKPEVFNELKAIAQNMGFAYVASGPLVRSSYKAGEMFIEHMLRSKSEPSIHT